MKINICYIIEEFVLGGAERVVIEQVKAIDTGHFNVFVCCLRQKGEFAYILEESGINIIELGKRRGLDLSIIPKIMKVIKDNKIGLVHTHLWVANFWGRLAAILSGVPVVITEHNVDVWKKWYHKCIDRILAGFTKKICVVSRQVEKFYVDNVGIKQGKIKVVYNGIDAGKGASSEDTLSDLRGEFGLRDALPVLANIGRLVEAKANHFFVEACDILVRRGVDFHALIVGDGPKRKELDRLVESKECADKIIFAGSRKDVPAILDIADVSVLSSTREGFSIVILESMARGVPFVATDVGGNRELIVDGQTGFLTPVNDPEALADAIEKIITSTELAYKMGEAARRRVEERFSLGRMVKEYEGVYR